MKKIPIDITLEKLYSLLVMDWGLAINDFVVVDEYAYLLQGYDVRGPEVKSGHLDVYVDPRSVPWLDKGERSIIPPKDSLQMDQWVNFMERTGYSLDLLRAVSEDLSAPTAEYVLQSGNKIRLMRVYEMTESFVKHTIMQYSLEDVSSEKIREWIHKLDLIKSAAEKQGDDRLVGLCNVKLEESKTKWRQIL